MEPEPVPDNDDLRVNADVHEYSLDRDVVLFHQGTGELFVLNALASDVWAAFKRGATYSAVAERVSRDAGVELGRVADDCRRLVEQWVGAGILVPPGREHDAPDTALTRRDDGRRGRVALDGYGHDDRGAERLRAPSPGRWRLPRRATGGRTYRLLDAAFRFAAPDAVARDVDDLLGHLGVPRSDAGPAPAALTAVQRDGAWRLLHERRIVGRCATAAELPSLALGTMLAMACETTPSLAMFHASAVANGERAVLMPGASGSGKSTLTAALTASGYAFCTDDLALLTGAPLGLRPVPLPIGLKSGSWPLLGRLLPALASTPVRPRADGKRIRYVLPPNVTADDGAPLTVAAIVFPMLAPGGTATLEPLPRAEALLRIADAGYDLPGTIEAPWVGAMTEWLRHAPCFELRYADLDDAVTAFSSVPA